MSAWKTFINKLTIAPLLLVMLTTNSNSSAETFDKMPLDMRVMVFSHLSDTDLLACGRVSSRWRIDSSLDRLWRERAEKYYLSMVNVSINLYFSLSPTAKLIKSKKFMFGAMPKIKPTAQPIYKYMLILAKLIKKEVLKESCKHDDVEYLLKLDPNLQIF